MSGLTKARIAFVIAIGLLVACALVVYGTLKGLSESELLVEHTQHVQVLLGDTESTIAAAARARLTYVFSGTEESLSQFQSAVARIPEKLAELRQNVKDNPAQQANCDRLEQLVRSRIRLWNESVSLKRSGTPQAAGQPDLTRQSVMSAEEIISVTQAMRDEESKLLIGRKMAAGLSFKFTAGILMVSFVTAVWLLFWHYRLQREELEARDQAEMLAHEAENKSHESEMRALASNEAARRLSGRLLQLQDDERRRLSRELHDSTGQHLAAAKMILSSLLTGHENDTRYSECLSLVDNCLREVRTISHLLHPSGLEEAGFSLAARWYAEEFANRSGLQVKVEISDLAERLPHEIEIALFRVLQEALANIHRHSKSPSAEVVFRQAGNDVALTISDRGIGIAPQQMEQFRSAGSVGVGLAGMRERVREIGGSFDIDSNSGGTTLRVRVPMPGARNETDPMRRKSSSMFTA